MTSALAATPSEHRVATRPYFAPVPNSLPPFDDQRAGTATTEVARLDQNWSATQLVQLRAATPVPPQRAEPPVTGESDETDRAAHHVATVLSRALVEVLSRRRPVSHLQRYCAPHLFAGLSGFRTTGPLRARSMRLGRPDPKVAEVSLVVQAGERVRAIAFRMEQRERWTITALEIG